jgi:iron complex transport system substrate-binding protein
VGAALRTIGKIAGTAVAAEASAAAFDGEIERLRAAHATAVALDVFIEIDDEPLFTVNGRHVISEVVELCGGRNVFADLPQLAPPVALEAVIARDPQVILSADDTIADPRALWSRWTRVAAVRDGAIYSMRSDTLTRATPRLADGARAVCAALDDARKKAAGRAR